MEGLGVGPTFDSVSSDEKSSAPSLWLDSFVQPESASTPEAASTRGHDTLSS